MNLKNTSKYSNNEVRRLVRFALGGLPYSQRLEVHVKNSKKHAMAGAFYPRIPQCSNVNLGRSFLIVARIGLENKFPRQWVYPGLKRCQKYAVQIQNWKEALIHTVSHESEHLRQWLKGKQFREDHAERRAYKTLMKYREKVK